MDLIFGKKIYPSDSLMTNLNKTIAGSDQDQESPDTGSIPGLSNILRSRAGTLPAMATWLILLPVLV